MNTTRLERAVVKRLCNHYLGGTDPYLVGHGRFFDSVLHEVQYKLVDLIIKEQKTKVLSKFTDKQWASLVREAAKKQLEDSLSK